MSSSVTRQNPATKLVEVDWSGGAVDMTPPCRAFYVGTGGTVELVAENDALTNVVTIVSSDAQLHPIAVRRFSAGSADDVVAIY